VRNVTEYRGNSPGQGIDSSRRTCGNELNCDGCRRFGAFVANNVHVVATGIDERHPLGVHLRLALGIIAFVVSDRSGGDDD
jgi:hypothetical protein